MALPKPFENETKEEFVVRCMEDETIESEFGTEKRFEIFSKLWDERDIETVDTVETVPVVDSPTDSEITTEVTPEVVSEEDSVDPVKPIEPETVSEPIVDEVEMVNESEPVVETSDVLDTPAYPTDILESDQFTDEEREKFKTIWDEKYNRSEDIASVSESEIERRYIPADIAFETREEDGELVTMSGYSAKFNTLFEDTFWGVRETIAPGAFKNALTRSDVRALWNHDSSMPLARSTINSGPGSLKLTEDDIGLFSEITPTDTSYARDLKANIEPGVVSQQSFAFTVKREMWEEDTSEDMVTRTILEIDQLYDVSPVTYPAYKDTDIAIKSSKDYQKLFRSFETWKQEHGKPEQETRSINEPVDPVQPEPIEQEPVDQQSQRDESARVVSRERIRRFKHARRCFNYKNRNSKQGKILS